VCVCACTCARARARVCSSRKKHTSFRSANNTSMGGKNILMAGTASQTVESLLYAEWQQRPENFGTVREGRGGAPRAIPLPLTRLQYAESAGRERGDSRAGRFSPAEISLVTTGGEIIVSLCSRDAMRNCDPFARRSSLCNNAERSGCSSLSRALHRFFLSIRKGEERERER